MKHVEVKNKYFEKFIFFLYQYSSNCFRKIYEAEKTNFPDLEAGAVPKTLLMEKVLVQIFESHACIFINYPPHHLTVDKRI